MSVLSVKITSDGKTIDQTQSLLSVDIRRELNRVPSAQLVYVDGDLASGKFPLSDSATFAVGSVVRISAGYADGTEDTKPLFEGVVVRHAVEASAQGSLLRVELRDKAVKLTQGRKSALFEQKKDSDVFKSLVGQAGLKAGQVEATPVTHAALVQYQCSDWDFLVTRAEAMGCVVTVLDGTVSLRKPAASGSAVLTVTLGLNVLASMAFEIDGLATAKSTSAVSWDLGKHARVEAKGKTPPALAPDDSRSGKLAAALFNAAPVMSAAATLTQDELEAWSTGALLRAELAAVRGRVCIQGTHLAELLALVEVAGVGKRCSGKLPITGLAHRIAEGDWRTDLQLGLSTRPQHLADDLASPPAAGLHPPQRGLSLATVTQVHEDPDKGWRVKVDVPGLADPPLALWARLALPSAGKERGWYLRPEVGDQVVVGCLGDDPRQPVVLGSLHTSKHPPPKDVSDDTSKNALSGFVTRSGLSLVLDDDKKRLLIKTPAGHQVLLDDDAKAMTLKDSHGNELTLDQDGVRIKSVKDLAFEASGNVTIQGSKIDLK